MKARLFRGLFAINFEPWTHCYAQRISPTFIDGEPAMSSQSAFLVRVYRQLQRFSCTLQPLPKNPVMRIELWVPNIQPVTVDLRFITKKEIVSKREFFNDKKRIFHCDVHCVRYGKCLGCCR